MTKTTIQITKAEENLRIDKLLSLRFPEKSRAYFQYLIEENHILLNNKQIKKRVRTSIDDVIEIFFAPLPEISLTPQDIKIDILYEDEDLIVINKSADMVVHPAAGNWDGTFVNALLYHCKSLPVENDDIRPGIVHRLDKETSGVLIAAKTTKAHSNLVNQFSQRVIKKTYLAICHGKPKDQTIDEPIGRNVIKRKEMQVTPKGKSAVTDIKLLSSLENISLVQASPHTGRTHQIRVHLKHIKSPIVGDKVYGNVQTNKKLNIDRHLLHAHTIKLNHPISNKPIEFTAPLPEDFKKAIQKFNLTF